MSKSRHGAKSPKDRTEPSSRRRLARSEGEAGRSEGEAWRRAEAPGVSETGATQSHLVPDPNAPHPRAIYVRPGSASVF
ncbi:unnamed protein product [Colias eurytheme]|nr:unnamed protein product [Colias eurytheme]